MNAKLRKSVLERDNYTCQYCGEQNLKKPEIDHINPRYLAEKTDNSLENLRTSCHSCNFYKQTFSVEKFRSRLSGLINGLRGNFAFRLAEKYGLVKVIEKDIVFEFEKNEEEV